MAENSPEFCDICQRLDISKPADAFCPKCEDFLCVGCQNHHKVAKLSNTHETTSIIEYKKLPTFIKNISIKCEDHENILEFFCKKHDNLCCKQCLISSHRDCKEITLIDDLLSMPTFHKSSPLDDIDQILQYTGENIHTAIKDRKRNLTEIRQQKEILLKEVNKKRQEMNDLLDHLEKTLLQKLSEVEQESHKQMEVVIKDLKERRSKIIQLQSDLALIKESASSLQIFMGIRELKESASSEEKHIKSLHCSGSLNNITIECIFDDQLKPLIENTRNLGKVEVKNAETQISFSWAGDKSAQLYTPSQIAQPLAKPIKDIQAKLVHSFKTCTRITGCAMLPTGKILLSDYNHGILKYDRNGVFESKIAIESSSAFSLAVVDDTTVVISGGAHNKCLFLVDIKSGNIIKKVDVQNWCYGVSFQDESYIVNTHWKGIKIVGTSQEIVANKKRFSNATGKDSYVASCKTCIVHSDFHYDTITCFNFKGELLWTYKASTLRKPCGITFDSDSNIYVAGSASNNIVMISPDGMNAKQLLDSSHGILDPRAIYFDKKDNVLLVANHQESAFVYIVL
ncbi:tripartite motif-containing protein 2-like [Mytilus trossulus]|uniref:tripartite motif-containing protein 2-like n=1 Tax=Mytilus trossulus TaxID=6551 RepID=UPI00300476BE